MNGAPYDASSALHEMGFKLSIVICTYNRCRWLDFLLHSLSRQTAGASEFEIIVVDNNSTDETASVVRRHSSRPLVRYVMEPEQGLSHARNRGWRETRSPYVAYIDDDAKAPPEWVNVALQIIDEHSPDVFGGPESGFYETPPPPWWKEAYRDWDLGDTARPLVPHEFLSGNNIVFRRELFDRIGGFNPALGMKGATIAVGEETELILRIRSQNPDALLYYHPGLFVDHLVHKDRMDLRKLVARWFASGQAQHHLYGPTPREQEAGPMRLLVYRVRRFFRDVSIGIPLRDRETFPRWQNYVYEHTSRHVMLIGRAYAYFRDRR